MEKRNSRVIYADMQVCFPIKNKRLASFDGLCFHWQNVFYQGSFTRTASNIALILVSVKILSA